MNIMKRYMIIYLMGFMFFTFSSGHAALWDRGEGMVYCPGINLTLRKTISSDIVGGAEKTTWTNAMALAGTSTWASYNDWRLPRLQQICWWNEEYSRYENCTGDRNSTHCTPSLMGGEIGHIFYDELGNSPGGDVGSKNNGPFIVTKSDSQHMIWFENNACVYDNNPPTTNGAFVFFWRDGFQNVQHISHSAWVWMVREGDSVPSPAPENHTSSGANITLQLDSANIIFSNVIQSGETYLSHLAQGSLNPQGAEGALDAFSLVTTAGFDGVVTVCYQYVPDSGTEETELKLVIEDQTGWRDITTSIDTNINRICGETTVLGFFAVTTQFVPASECPIAPLMLLLD